MPTIQRPTHAADPTVHLDILYTLPNDLTAGLRLAFDVNQASWGFTPLLNRQIADLEGGCALFGEVVFRRVPEGSGEFRRVPEVPEGSERFRRVPEVQNFRNFRNLRNLRNLSSVRHPVDDVVHAQLVRFV